MTNDIPTLAEFLKKEWALVRGTDKEPSGMYSAWAFNLMKEKEYYKKYEKELTPIFTNGKINKL